MTQTPERPGPPAGAAPTAKVATALRWYRVLAWATGIWLIALCYEIFVRYVLKVDNPPTWIGVVHGWVYFIYLIATANLALQVRWPVLKTVGVLLAGTIPLLGLIVEHVQTQDIKTRFGLVDNPRPAVSPDR